MSVDTIQAAFDAAKSFEDGLPPQNQTSDDFKIEVMRLSALPKEEYDRQRKDAAKQLGIRTGTLDEAIAKVRGTQPQKLTAPFESVENWPYPVNGAELLDEIQSVIHRFIICEQETAIAATLWVVMTWLMDVVQVAPLAVITAPEKRCGKSQLLFVLNRLVVRPLAASAISPAALFRCIDAWSPTLLIDETDALLRDNEELRGLLNAGHTRETAFVVRCVGDDFTPQKFSVWGAKALAGIGSLPDTLMDRAIILELRRKLAHEQTERLRYADGDLFKTIAQKLARWAADNAQAIAMTKPDLPPTLNDRAQDNWEPLLAIAMVAGSDWLRRARDAALRISGNASVPESAGQELLDDIKTVLEIRAADRITSADLIAALCDDPEAAWATYNRGKPIAPRQLAKKLKAYGIHSKTIRLGMATAKGYEHSQFEDAFFRYLPSTPLAGVTASQATASLDFSVTEAKSVTVTRNEKVTEKANVSADCDGVTDRNPLKDVEDCSDEWATTI